MASDELIFRLSLDEQTAEEEEELLRELIRRGMPPGLGS